MKIPLNQILLLLTAGLVFSGCYTQYNATSVDKDYHDDTASHIEGGWFEVDGSNFYIDYYTRDWYSYYGIDLATDRNFLKMAHFNYHHPTSTYFFSPFSSSFFYNRPGYSNHYFLRIAEMRGITRGAHPPYYSNQYMWSFYYNRWANWYYWQSVQPNYWEASALNAHDNSLKNSITPRGTSVSGINREIRSNQVSSRLSLDRDDQLRVSSRNQITLPEINTTTLREREQTLADRRGADYIERLERNRAARTQLNNFSDWQRQRIIGVPNRSVHNARTTRAVNRAASNNSGRSSAVRGVENRNSSFGNGARTTGSTRSSGESTSSRGSN